MFNLFKKKISIEEMAVGLYTLFIHDTVKIPKKDIDGNIILNKEEQALLSLAHLCTLLDKYGLRKVIPHLQSIFVKNWKKAKTKADWTIQMLSITDSVKKIRDFFENIPAKDYEFYKKDFPFKKELNPIQKHLCLVWYVEHAKAIDSVFGESFKKFKIQDK